MTKEKIEIGKSYKLNKTIGIDKCGSKLFVKGAVVKAISYGYGFAIELNHFIWRPSLEDLDEIEEESNESNVDKLLALRYAILNKKIKRWNCKIMKENNKGKIKMEKKEYGKVGANWVDNENSIDRLPDRKQLIEDGVELGLWYYEGRWVERIKVADIAFISKESTQEYLNNDNVKSKICIIHADWFDIKKES